MWDILQLASIVFVRSFHCKLVATHGLEIGQKDEPAVYPSLRHSKALLQIITRYTLNFIKTYIEMTNRYVLQLN